MELSGKEQKSSYQINRRLILGLIIVLGFFSLIFTTTMLSASSQINKRKAKKADSSQTERHIFQGEDSKSSLIGVFKKLDENSKQVTVFDISGHRELVVTYSGASNITDEYGQIITISQIEPGDIVELAYQSGSGKLTDMSISPNAWKYVGVSNFTLDTDSGIMKIAKKRYKLPEGITVLDGNDFVSIYDIALQDVLTIWGYDDTIWSVIVTKGHGYVKLQDYEDFLGDYITIGYESMQQITEDMMITVREGEYNLTVENGDYSATMRVTVNRNEITYASLKELGPKASKYGKLLFDISPFGAELYIKGELISYSDGIELPYGTYPIKVSMGGYVSYEGTLNVDSPAKTIKIILPEVSGNQTVEVSEIDSRNNQDGSINSSDNANIKQGSGNSDNRSDDNDSGSNGSSDFLVIGEKIIDTKHQIHVQKPLGA